MPQSLDDLPELVKTLLDEAGVDLDRYTGCRYIDRGGHYFVALYPAEGVDERAVDQDAGRLQAVDVHAGVGERGWLLLPQVKKPGALDPDIQAFHPGETGEGED